MNSTKSKTFRRLLAVLLMLALVAAACGSSDDGDTAAETGSSDTDTAEADSSAAADSESADEATPEEEAGEEEAAEPAASDSDAFVYAMPFSFVDLDPNSSFGTENIALQNVYETLTVYNPPGSADLLSPGLAESWESSDDSLQWTFNLRDDVTFHDGTSMTSEQVIGSLQNTIDLGLGASFIFGAIQTMTAVDDHTVQFDLEFPAPLDLVMSSNYGAYILSPEAIGQDSEWFNAGNSSGTGPYMMSSHDPATSTMLTAYEGYWGGWEDDAIMEVEFRLVEDPVLAEQLIRSGDVDYTYNLPFDSYLSLDGADGVSVVRGQSMTNLFGLLNNERLSAELREALVLSFPYNDVAASLYGGEATRAQGIIPQAVWGAAGGLKLPDTDLDRAAELVQEAGADGTEIVYSYDAGGVEQEQIGVVWQANLSTIGIDLVLDPLTFDARAELARANPAEAQDVFTMSWFPTYVTPFDFLFSLFATEEDPFFNLGYYSNEDFDNLIFDADALTASDLEGAIANFEEAQQILVDDHAAVFMLDTPDVSVMASDISGHTQNPAYSNVVRFHDLGRS